MQTVSIKEASMSQLLDFHNTHVVRLLDGKTTKRFSDRKAAEARCAKLGDQLASYFADAPDSVPPEGMIFIGPLVTEDGEKVEIEAVNSKPVAALNGHEAGAADEEEAEDEPTVNSFAAMGGTLGALGEKGETAPVRSTNGRASNSAGVAASWAVPDVRFRRLTRDSVEVTVDGETGSYKSTHEAFRAYRLPESKHIRFRLKLKASRAETFVDGGKTYAFRIVEGTVEE